MLFFVTWYINCYLPSILFLLFCFFFQDLEPSQLLAYDVADHTDARMDTGGEKPDLGDRYGGVARFLSLFCRFCPPYTTKYPP